MQDIPTLITVLVESPGGGALGQSHRRKPHFPGSPSHCQRYDAVGVRIQDLPITAERSASRAIPSVWSHGGL